MKRRGLLMAGLCLILAVLVAGCFGAKKTPPGSFNLVSPADGATDVSINPTLSWSAASGATSYTLVVADNQAFANPVFNQNVGDVTSKQISGLAYSTTYYWKVTAHNSAGSTGASNNGARFTTMAQPMGPPGSFNLLSPADGATDVSINPTLSWSAASGATSYTLVVADNQAFANPVFNQNVGDVTSKQISGLAYSTTYYWKVTAHNSAGSTEGSNNGISFITERRIWTVHDWQGTSATGEPPTGWQEISSMNSYCTINNGILVFNTISDATKTPNYRYDFDQLPDGFMMTLIFKARATGTGRAWTFDFQGPYRGGVELSANQIKLLSGTSGIGTYSLDGTAWHTYFITCKITLGTGMEMKVYLDGDPNPVLSGTATAQTSNKYMRIGDTSSSESYAGEMDWIMWSFEGAFVPGQVNLPPGYSLTP